MRRFPYRYGMLRGGERERSPFQGSMSSLGEFQVGVQAKAAVFFGLCGLEVEEMAALLGLLGFELLLGAGEEVE